MGTAFGKARERPVDRRVGRSRTLRQAAPARGAHARELRIIAGRWRGRRWRFVADADIRPTPDRVRETLFNWLGVQIAGARCLDLFAGSGALGLEALSRGAAQVTFVESQAAAARELERLLAAWGAPEASVRRADAVQFLARTPTPFEVVFLDPPFASGLLAPVAQRLEGGGWLAPRARVYVECAARSGLPALPPEWHLLKAKRAGEVGYHLLERDTPSPGTR
jgi:16S rRNA (guanine966-N2)-methyltransferase